MNQLTRGLDALSLALIQGCTLAFQDGEWVLFDQDGDGLESAVTLRELVGKLGKE